LASKHKNFAISSPNADIILKGSISITTNETYHNIEQKKYYKAR